MTFIITLMYGLQQLNVHVVYVTSQIPEQGYPITKALVIRLNAKKIRCFLAN